MEDREGGASGCDRGMDEEAAFEGEDVAPGSVGVVGWRVGETAVVVEGVVECSYSVCQSIVRSLFRF